MSTEQMPNGIKHEHKHKYISPTQLVEILQNEYHNTLNEIVCVFIPKLSQTKNIFDANLLTICGLIVISSRKLTPINYDNIISLFGSPIKISVKTNKKRNIIPTLPLQALRINTESETFTPKPFEGEEQEPITYYPSKTTLANAEMYKKLHQSMLDYLAKGKEEDKTEDEQ